MGAYILTTPIVIKSPYVTLEFKGSNVTYTGSSAGITYSDVPTSYGGSGGIRNQTLHGTSASGAIGILITEVTFNVFYNMNIRDFTAGKGIVFSNAQKWTENNQSNHVHGSNNAVDMEFEDNYSGHTGCPSFSYTSFKDVEMSVQNGGIAYNLLHDSGVNASFIEWKCFPANGSTCLHLQNTSQIWEPLFFSLTGELSGAEPDRWKHHKQL